MGLSFRTSNFNVKYFEFYLDLNFMLFVSFISNLALNVLRTQEDFSGLIITYPLYCKHNSKWWLGQSFIVTLVQKWCSVKGWTFMGNSVTSQVPAGH